MPQTMPMLWFSFSTLLMIMIIMMNSKTLTSSFLLKKEVSMNKIHKSHKW